MILLETTADQWDFVSILAKNLWVGRKGSNYPNDRICIATTYDAALQWCLR